MVQLFDNCRWVLLCMAPLLGFMWSCAPTPVPKPPDVVDAPSALLRISTDQLPPFEDHLNYQDLDRSIQQSLNYLRRLPPDRPIRFGPDQYPVSHLIRSLEVFARLVSAEPAPEVLHAQIKAHYHIYGTAQAASHSVLLTGYYEPLLMGSPTRSAQFPIPIHAKPSDMMEINLGQFASDLKGRRIVARYTGSTVVPYPSRGQIRKNRRFNAVAKPVAWLKDEIDLFVLQIQGSGKVQMPDGETIAVQYNGSNGRPYRSVGRMLIRSGAIPAKEMSMQAIRSYLKQHPDKLAAILDHNPRYIFFRQGKGDGPLGSLGQPLTPYRSVAVDHGVFPSAALAYMTTELPRVDENGVIVQWAPYKGFVLAQDAGSAIKGPARADFFMGAGNRAEVAASHLKHPSQLYFLILKPGTAGM